jgi:hypothetical protein
MAAFLLCTLEGGLSYGRIQKREMMKSGWDVFGAVMLLTSVFGFMGWLTWPGNSRLDGAQQFPPPQIVGMNIPASPPGGPPH